MPYNSYFPVGYQPMGNYYPQQYAQPQQVQNVPQMQQQQQTQTANPTMTSGIIWVQGEAGAKSSAEVVAVGRSNYYNVVISRQSVHRLAFFIGQR